MKRKHIRLRTKFTASSLFLAVVLCVVLTIASYTSYSNSMVDKYREQITSIANTAAEMIPQERVREYIEESARLLESGGDVSSLMDEEYMRLYEQFKIISHQNGLEFLYCYHPDPEGLRILAQGTVEGEEFHYMLGQYLSVANGDYSQADIDYANELINNPNAERIYISESKFGYFITAFTVVNDADGNPYLVVGADMSMAAVRSALNNYLALVIVLAVAIVGIFITAYLVYLRVTMVRPLQKVVDSAVKFVETGRDDKLTSMNVKVKTGDELEELAEAFNKMTEDIVKYIKNLTVVTAEKERISAELNVATKIQASMLPTDFPERGEFEIFATMTPAKEVGGDFYDFFMIDDDHLAVVIADVSGKGVPAALFMVNSKTAIMNTAQMKNSPSDVFTIVNEQLCAHNEGGLFVTAWMGVLEISSGVLTYVNAGHNPPAIKNPDGKYEFLKCRPGFVLAGMEGMKYRQAELTLQKGSTLYLYTDGVTEATNASNELFGENRLLETLNDNPDAAPDELLNEVMRSVDGFVKDAPQFDDITMLGLKIK